MKKFALLLIVIFVTAGSAQARISSSRTFAHFPTCTDGLVKQMCVCRSLRNPLGPLISFVRLDGIATHSTARADSNKQLAAKPLSKDEARRIAVNIVRLLELFRRE